MIQVSEPLNSVEQGDTVSTLLDIVPERQVHGCVCKLLHIKEGIIPTLSPVGSLIFAFPGIWFDGFMPG